MSIKYEPLDELEAFRNVDLAANAAALSGKDDTLPKKEEEEDEKPVWAVHVEARLKPSSPALSDSIKKSVKKFLSGYLQNLILPSTVTGWNTYPDLANNIDLLRITESTCTSNRVPFSQAELEIHVYQPTDGDAFEEFATSKTDGEEVVAASVCELPCRNWDGLWDTLVYSDDIKPRLLNYIHATLVFSERDVDFNVVSWNRVVLLHGPPGTGKTSLCRALAQKLAIRLSERYPAAKLVEINSHSLFSRWFSESGKLVQRLFASVTEMIEEEGTFVVLLIDEVESLTAARAGAMSGNEPSDALRVVNALLTQLDKLKHRKNVLVMTTSNLVDAIDAAFIDRADIVQYVGLPPQEAIYGIIQSCINELIRAKIIAPVTILEASESELQLLAPNHPRHDERTLRVSHRLWELAGKCQGMSGRTLRRLPVLAHARHIGASASLGSRASGIEVWLDAMVKVVEEESNERVKKPSNVVLLKPEILGVAVYGGRDRQIGVAYVRRRLEFDRRPVRDATTDPKILKAEWSPRVLFRMFIIHHPTILPRLPVYRQPAFIHNYFLPRQMPAKRGRANDASQVPARMTKRTKRVDEVDEPQKPQKKHDNSIYETPGIVATAQAAAAVDANPPFQQLNKARTEHKKTMLGKPQENGDAVVYWMRMQDMRILDNRALEGASKCARERGIPLLVVFLFSVGDYRAHDRSPRRIDFVLRNLNILKDSLAELHIPLHTFTVEKRKTVPNRIVDLMNEWDVKDLFVNVEYEVDELRRDLKLLELSTAAGIRCGVYHDRCLVQPGQIKTKDGKMSSIYTPWMKQWSSAIQSHPDYFKEAHAPVANDPSIHKHSRFGPLFHDSIPDAIPGFECEDADKMAELWPAGTDAALKALDRFLETKARKSQTGDKSILEPGAEKSANLDDTRIGQYEDQRVRLDMDSSSRLSPYLATGAICARQCVRAVMKKHSNDTFNASRGSGPGVWIQEIGWRDFYTHIMAAYPRVSMGRPYHEKYADVFWEEDVDGKILEAWKEGKTGYPIVDAAMRQCKTQGYMHNRARMIAAMFLTKDLMIDWRLGERHFMRSFLDGDLGSNNGGWQWCASTGTDPQPWFRIFNPYLQSEKADPQGDYIRHFVPELRKLDNKAIHDPFTNLTKADFEKLGYPKPMVDHKFARDRAIRRFKNVGEE